MGKIRTPNIITSVAQATPFLLENNVGSVHATVYPPHLSENVQ